MEEPKLRPSSDWTGLPRDRPPEKPIVYRRFFMLGPVIVLGLLTFAWSAPRKHQAGVQGDEVLTLDFQDAPALEILAGISDKLKRPVVLDGTCKMRATVHMSLPRSLVLQSVARVLDLEVREGKGRAAIFTQRFEDEAHLPQASPAEIQALAANVLRALPNAQPDPDHDQWGADLRRLATTLSAQQKKALEAGDTIAFGDLDPAQRDLVTQCIYCRVLGGPRYFYTMLSAVSSDPERTLVKMDSRQRTLIVEPPPRSQMARISLGIQLPEGGKP